jgi:hypothetical protein
MATKLSRPLHIPRVLRPGVLGMRAPRAPRARMGSGLALPRQCQAAPDQGARPERANRWPVRALREGVVVTLLTSLLTSAVLAAPEVFRQSPAVSWRQVTTPALAEGPVPGRGVLLDCP